MIGRRTVWSDNRLIELAKKFVVCTDEVWRLEKGSDPDCIFFQAIARQGHYPSDDTPSKQGIYVVSANGKFLSSINSNNPDAVIATLEKGLKLFESLDASEKKIQNPDKVKPKNRPEDSQPADGLILAVYSRDLPTDLNPKSKKATRWNRDTAWFSKSEMQSLIPDDAKPGTKFTLPNVFAHRMVRHHLVDMINGQTDSFEESEVVNSKLSAVVKSVTDDEIEFELLGATQTDSDSSRYRRKPRGVVTSLVGSAIYSKSKQRFSKFEMTAVGYRWGRTAFNGRRRGPKTNPVGFAIELAPADEPANVPGLFYDYEVDWKSNSGSE